VEDSGRFVFGFSYLVFGTRYFVFDLVRYQKPNTPYETPKTKKGYQSISGGQEDGPSLCLCFADQLLCCSGALLL
jgi:hypothetical protein